MADEIKPNTDIDLDTVELGSSPNSAPTPATAPIPAATTTQSVKPDLNEKIKNLEAEYKEEVSIKENFSEKIGKLLKIKKGVEESIKNNEGEIEEELTELKNLKNKIEAGIKKVNKLKEAHKEIGENIEEANHVEEKIAGLEDKLKDLG